MPTAILTRFSPENAMDFLGWLPGIPLGVPATAGLNTDETSGLIEAERRKLEINRAALAGITKSRLSPLGQIPAGFATARATEAVHLPHRAD